MIWKAKSHNWRALKHINWELKYESRLTINLIYVRLSLLTFDKTFDNADFPTPSWTSWLYKAIKLINDLPNFGAFTR